MAQEVSVEGAALDAETVDPLPGVNIVEVSTNRGTTSGIEGSSSTQVSSANATLRFSPQGDNIRAFYKTGYKTGATVSNPVALSGSNEPTLLRASHTNLQNQRLLPGQEIDQNTFSLPGTADLTERLSVMGRGAYLKRTAFNRPNLADIPDDTVRNFLFMPRSVSGFPKSVVQLAPIRDRKTGPSKDC